MWGPFVMIHHDDMMIWWYIENVEVDCNGGCHVQLKNQNWGPWWACGERWPKLPTKITWFSVIAGPFGRSLNVSSQKTKPDTKIWSKKKWGKKFRWEDVFLRFFWGIAVMFQSWFGVFSKSWGCQRRRWPPAAGRWFSKWMGVACRLSPFTKMDGTACWGIGDSEGKRGAIVLFNCDTFLKILQRSWTIQEDPGKFMNQILQSTKIPPKKRVHDESLIYASSLDVTIPPFDASAGSLGACIAGLDGACRLAAWPCARQYTPVL